jgi:hypothetical protein
MLAWPEVVLGVIAVVEEAPVVQPSVVAGRAVDVFEVPLQRAEAKPREVSRHIDAKEE